MNDSIVPVSISNFSEVISMESPLPLSDEQKRERSKISSEFLKLTDMLLDSIRKGNSPLLPDMNGNINLKPVINAGNKKNLSGIEKIMLLTKASELNAPTNIFITYNDIVKAFEHGIDCSINKGEHGITIPVVQDHNWYNVISNEKWFNICQLKNPEKIIEFYKNMEPEKNRRNYPFNKNTREPYQYLYQILKALDMNASIREVPEKNVQLFTKKILAILSAEYKPGKRDVFAVQKIACAAKKYYEKIEINFKPKKILIRKNSLKKVNERTYER